MSWEVYIALSVVMFFQYAVWGAWAPVLAARLLGPLKMTGKQTGWIYATLPIACIFAPLGAGWVADRWLNAEWILIAAHLFGAVLMFLAARQQKFAPLLVVMLLYSVCYATTLPLANSVLFAATSGITVDDIVATSDVTQEEVAAMSEQEVSELVGGTIDAIRGKVFLWAPVAWALVGWLLTGWRMTRKTQGDGSDCLYFAAALSILMALGCVYVSFASPTPPAATVATAVADTAQTGTASIMDMFCNANFLIFLVISLVIFGLMQFYFLGTAQFMQDKGVSSKHVPASMALAQIAQALATLFLFGLFLNELGFKWALTFGATCWFVMYLCYVMGQPRWLLILCQPLHGLAYVFFVIFGQVFTDAVSPEEIRSTMQALIFAATTGVGLFLGTQFAGIVMDRFAADGKFDWRKIWLVPCLITGAGVVALILLFSDPPKEEAAAASQTPEAVVQSMDDSVAANRHGS